VLEYYRQPVKLMFVTLSPDALKHLRFDSSQLTASIEDISTQLDPLLQHIWGKQMYRVVLTVKSTNVKNKIKYRIL
jgi:hypothetical protein